MRLRAITGRDIVPFLDSLAELRIRVFREWPYLYEGDRAYEEQYLSRLAASEAALLVAAFEGDRVIGASTSLPLAAEHAELRAPFEAEGLDPADWYYLAESVLLAPYRGLGLGRRFFEIREVRARELGFSRVCFAAVVRDPHDPRKPDAYRDLDSFWRRLDYERRDGLVARLAWKELGEEGATPKPLRFWTKAL